MLSFTVYYLLRNPHSLGRLRAEVDAVIGDRPIALEDLGKLPYLQGVLDPYICISSLDLTISYQLFFANR
jgi:cytochrome P450